MCFGSFFRTVAVNCVSDFLWDCSVLLEDEICFYFHYPFFIAKSLVRWIFYNMYVRALDRSKTSLGVDSGSAKLLKFGWKCQEDGPHWASHSSLEDGVERGVSSFLSLLCLWTTDKPLTQLLLLHLFSLTELFFKVESEGDFSLLGVEGGVLNILTVPSKWQQV